MRVVCRLQERDLQWNAAAMVMVKLDETGKGREMEKSPNRKIWHQIDMKWRLLRSNIEREAVKEICQKNQILLSFSIAYFVYII